MSGAWDVETLVDLGEDFDVRPSGSPLSARWARARRLRLAAPACALLFLAAASSAPPPSAARLVAGLRIGVDASVMIEGSDLYVYDLREGRDGISAYDLADGRRLWSAAAPELATETTMSYVDGRVIVSMADTDPGGEHTVAFDARTGRREWTNEFGFAVVVRGGVLVESAPRPPGFNYPGTVPTATFRLLDAQTGDPMWTVAVPDNCVTALASPTGGLASDLVELCLTSSRLTEIDLADGRPTASRGVDLGDPSVNVDLPLRDRLYEPWLIAIGDTVLVAHANTPTPTIDAYAQSDLRQRWTGVSFVPGQQVELCGTAVCVYNGEASGAVIDLGTGDQIGRTPPRRVAQPGQGSLVLLPLGQAVAPPDVAALPSTPTGLSAALPAARDPRSAAPGGDAMMLARWHVSASGIEAAAPIDVLRGVAARSCASIGGYVACATAADRLSVWRLWPRG